VPLRWELFSAETSDWAAFTAYEIVWLSAKRGNNAILEEDALHSDFLHESVFSRSPISFKYAKNVFALGNSTKGANFTLKIDPPERTPVDPFVDSLPVPWGNELRRLVYATRWKRKDPVTQLPPGSVHEMTYSVTTGLSIEHSETLAKSLGMSIGGSFTGLETRLNSHLNRELGIKVDVTSQVDRSTKLTLTNTSNDHYRLFALWHVVHKITVDALELPLSEHQDYTTELQPKWASRGVIEFVTTNEPFVTFAEIKRRSTKAPVRAATRLPPPEP
jgi:hypothetical protein